MANANQDTKRTSFQVPEEMRTFAEQSLTQARQALDGFLGAARRTAETLGQTTDRVQAWGQGPGPEGLVLGRAEPADHAGLRRAARAGQGSSRGCTGSVRVCPDAGRGHAGPNEGVRVGGTVPDGTGERSSRHDGQDERPRQSVSPLSPDVERAKKRPPFLGGPSLG